MTALYYMAAAMAVGAMVAVQPPLNAILTRAVGNPFGATVISVLVALVSASVFLVLSGLAGFRPAALVTVPWWVYLAGVVGALFVVAGAVIPPVTGGLLFFVCVVAGQLLGAMVLDHFGLLGLAVREVSVWRVMGFVLVMSGALMVLRG